eukprot:TRINITY_DN28218_c0_g1_i1.p1 TRINITY_DN28218_c0_g1~~TRINITY_DN28218_c0_g1_i1.p1  ORF type:complete len:443 (+),score=94.00 TRINITY_DN28218_c0_g1_i1:56-1384(+)
MSTARRTVFWTTAIACLSLSASLRQAEPRSGTDAECRSAADCKGFQGECQDGECWYTAHELNGDDEEWPECISGCSNFFDNFFQAPEAAGQCTREGFVCQFWKNLLERVVSQGGSRTPETEWRSLLQDLGALDTTSVGAVPGLSPGSTATVTNCYCSRLCEMGSAADLGHDARFWQDLSNTGASVDLTRLSVMELVHAEFQESLCDSVKAISLTGIVAVATMAGISEAPGSSFMQSAILNGSSPTSLQQLDGFFNPLDCLSKLHIFARSAPSLGKVAAPKAATVAHEAAKAAGSGSLSRNFLAMAGKSERAAAEAIKHMPFFGHGASKFLKDLGKHRMKDVAGAFGNTFGAATVVTRIAAGDIGGGAGDAAVMGITKLAGGSLGGAVGLTGGAAVIFGAFCGIGISIGVSAGVALLTGGTATTAAAAGAGSGLMGILKHGCK